MQIIALPDSNPSKYRYRFIWKKSYFSSILSIIELSSVGRNSNENKLSPIALMKSITFSGMKEPSKGRTMIICSWFIIPNDELDELEVDTRDVTAVVDIPLRAAIAAIALIASAVLVTSFGRHEA
jgi:hypothetical protein